MTPVLPMPSSQDEELRTAASVLIQRYQWLRQAGITFGGDRDLYSIFGYDRQITARMYRERYMRGGIAKRIVEAFPKATWRGGFELIEDEDPEHLTAFEKAWEELDERLNITNVLLRADILAGLSTFSIVLLGTTKGDLDQEIAKGKPEDLIYLTPFSGGGGPANGHRLMIADLDVDCMIRDYDIDITSKRFGLPAFYQIRRTDIAVPSLMKPVHHSRILHLAEGTLDDEVYGPPTLEACWNLLDDLEKVSGGGAEAFFQRANQGMNLNIEKGAELSADAIEKLKDAVEEYKHNVTRVLRTREVDVKMLGSDVANFNQPADAILTQIAGCKSIPKRILTGSEMGELASSQDRDNWKDQISGRQTGYAEPKIVRPLIDRLIEYGYLPEPKEYDVKWAHMQTLTEQEKSEGAVKWATVNQTYGRPVFTDSEIRDKWYEMAPLTPEQMKEATPEPPATAVDPGTGLPVKVDINAGLPAHMTDGMTTEEKAAVIEQEKEKRAKEKEQEAKRAVKLKAAAEFRYAEGHDYASTQVNLSGELATRILDFAAAIPDADLADDGREDTPHVTVKYGLHDDDPTGVEKLLADEAPVALTLGPIKVFQSEDYDVVFISVKSPDLKRLNTKISDGVQVTDTWPTYRPHVTLAYLKRGSGEQYEGDKTFDGETVVLDTVVFSPTDGEVTEIQLRAAMESEEEMLRVLADAVRTNNMVVVDEILGVRHLSNPNHVPAGSESGGQFTSSKIASAKDAEKVLDKVFGGPKASRAVRKRANLSLLRDISTEQLQHAVKAYEYLKANKPAGPFAYMALPRIQEELAARLKGASAFTLDDETLLETLGSSSSGNFGHVGRPGEIGGSATSAAHVEFNRLKRKWAHINDDVLGLMQDGPSDSPEVLAKLDEMKQTCKEIYALDLDKGGLEGIGLPGGPRDVVIVGAGPGGLAAAMMAGTDGLDTLVVEGSPHIGGQAKFSSRVENYPGFPVGITGEQLAKNLHEQALRVGAEVDTNVKVTGITHDEATGIKTVTLSDGRAIEARAVVIAGGVEFNHIEFPGSDSANVIYGDSKALAKAGTGKAVTIIGGSNGAAQAALAAARTASQVTVISRSPIDAGMSDYQVQAMRAHKNITVIEGDELRALESGQLVLKSGKSITTDALGMFVGSSPKTDWLPPQVTRERGKVKVNADLETEMPGVFAVGDVRVGGIGRIGGAVGDGQLAERNIFQYFGKIKKQQPMRAAMSPARAAFKDEWFGTLDDLFDLDKQHPYLGQTVELRTAGGAGSGNFGHQGRPGEVGGSSNEGGAPWQSAGGFEHTGIHWKQPVDANGRPIPIKVDTVEEAAALVLDGKVVEVKDVGSAFTLINRLAEIANEAKAAGKEAKDYDLCQVSVAGSNMFCADSLKNVRVGPKIYKDGVPRLEMPQLGGKPVPGSEADKLPRNPWDKSEVDGAKQFVTFLQGLGVKTKAEVVPAASLKASQREMIGSKVAGIMRDTTFDPAKNPVFVSSDGYVIDGHHRWAAVVGRDAADGKLGDRQMNIIRVNAPISEVLHIANTWSAKFGIQQAAGVVKQAKETGLHKG